MGMVRVPRELVGDVASFSLLASRSYPGSMGNLRTWPSLATDCYVTLSKSFPSLSPVSSLGRQRATLLQGTVPGVLLCLFQLGLPQALAAQSLCAEWW